MPQIVKRHFEPTGKVFIAALRRTLPDLPADECVWRLHWMFGTMGHALSGHAVFGPPCDEKWEARISWLVAFLAGGFRAPAAQKVSEVEVTK